MTAFPPNQPSPAVTVAQIETLVGQIDSVFLNIARRLHTMRARLYSVEAQFALQAQGRKPRMPVSFNSQFGEDALIWEAMNGPLTGLYIEVGAFDGESYAVTYGLDAIGWDGLLVEAIPEQVERCRKSRPHAKVEHAILTSPGAPPVMQFTVLDDGQGGMNSYSTTTDEQRRNTAHYPHRTISVPTATLDSLLEKHFPGREVDVAVIDVEGAEVDVLGGFDLTRWKPRLVIVEDNSRGQDKRLDEFFAGKPYTMATWLEVNRVYVRNDQQAMLRFLKPQ